MAKAFKVRRKPDIKHFRATSMKTKKVNRATGNTQGGIRF